MFHRQDKIDSLAKIVKKNSANELNINKISAKYPTFLHKPLNRPVFMRSLAMYDGLNILHKSYIILHFLLHCGYTYALGLSRAQNRSGSLGNRWTPRVHPLPTAREPIAHRPGIYRTPSEKTLDRGSSSRQLDPRKRMMDEKSPVVAGKTGGIG